LAKAWIKDKSLSGVLTKYPVNVGFYDWCITSGFFTVKYPNQSSPQFIEQFSCASVEHYHFEDGECVAGDG
jgi:hypothetical protein